MQDVVTNKGQSLLFELREEAQRQGLPELEKASDEQLGRLVRVLPEDLRRDAEARAIADGCPVQEVMIDIIRFVLLAERPEAS